MMRKFLFTLTALALLLAACTPTTPAPTPTAAFTATPSPLPPTPTPTPMPLAARVDGAPILLEDYTAELTRLQAAYRANAQVIGVARDLFDQILGLAR